MSLKLNIDELLKKDKRNLVWLSNETGISYNALSKIKKGKTKKIEFTTIEKILKTFKCKPNSLFKITK